MNNQEQSIHYFSKSFNCSQSVLAAFGPDFGLDHDLCLKLGAGFGAGMGYQGKTCGAVSGAYLVLGLLAGKRTNEQSIYKEFTYGLTKEFVKKFEEIDGATICNELLGARIDTEEGLEYIKENGLFQTLCPKFVTDAVKILEEIIIKYNKTDSK